MNKLFSLGIFSILLMAAPAVFAQETGETAPADLIPEISAPAPIVSAPSSVSNEDPTSKILREGVPLRVRQEQGFDANGNNRLEPNEIRAFFKAVYDETASGEVKNTSDVLYPFDKDKDGFISRSEASSFPR